MKNEKCDFYDLRKNIAFFTINSVKKPIELLGVKKTSYICTPFKKFSINSLNRYKDDESRNRY